MNKEQRAALKAANLENATISANETIINAEILEVKKDKKDSETFNDGKPEPKQHKPSTNVAETVVPDLAKEARTALKAEVKRLINTFDYKMGVLLEACKSVKGANYLVQNNLTIDQITKKQVLKTLTSLVVNGKNLHVRIVPMKEDKSNVLNAEFLGVYLGSLDEKGILQPANIETVEIKYSVLDRNFVFEQNEQNELLLTKGSKTYTVSIVETLNYNVIIDRLASYRKIANIQAAKLVQARTDERLKAEKAVNDAKAKADKLQAAKTKVLSTFSKDELLAMAQMAS